jgi:hypothetical protein
LAFEKLTTLSGEVRAPRVGTPQGGPHSPLLANVLLDEVDRELEKRGHAFVRYADDGKVYVRSRRAGELVIALLSRLYDRLRLRINESKSAVARVWERKFLGFSFWTAPGKKGSESASPTKPLSRWRASSTLTRQTCGRSLGQVVKDLRPYLVGWRNYFRLADTPGIFRVQDEWFRHRHRALQLKQWAEPFQAQFVRRSPAKIKSGVVPSPSEVPGSGGRDGRPRLCSPPRPVHDAIHLSFAIESR